MVRGPGPTARTRTARRSRARAERKSSDDGDGEKDETKNGKGKRGGEKNSGPEGDGAKEKGQQGGEEESGGFNPQKPLPQERRQDNEASGRGHVDDEELEKRLRAAKGELASDKSRQRAEDTQHLRSGKLEADQWRLPNHEQATPQRELTAGVLSNGKRALPNEQGEIGSLGYQLGARLKRIKSQARAPVRFQKRGKLDRRRFAASQAGNPNVFLKKGVNIDLDLEIDVSIDRSGSVQHAGETENQYRMAKMFAVAGNQTKIPLSIYGWDGGGASARHFAYKEKHSEDLTALDSIFQTGGGGTPTAEGVRFSRARFRRSKAKNRIMVVITDGDANNPEETREQIDAARRDGIKVVAMAFGCAPAKMNTQFGPGNWVAIDDYVQAPESSAR